MKNDRIFAVAASAAFGLLVCLNTLAFGDEPSDWVVRTVASNVYADSVDVMTGPDGEVIVGYGSQVPAAVGNATVARLPAGAETFQYRTDLGVGSYASFAADRFGNVFYATNDKSGQGIRVGQDFGGFGDLPSSYVPGSESAILISVPTIGVNPNGMPVVAYADSEGARCISSFDAIAERWATESLAEVGASWGNMIFQSLAFDASGTPVVSFVGDNASRPGGSSQIVAVRNSGRWENIAGDTAIGYYFGTAPVAAAPDGSVGFAYIDSNGQLCFNSYGGCLGTPESIIDASVYPVLSPHSLAYDNDGNPAVLYHTGELTYSPLHLARRDGSGQWTDEALPVHASMGSLTFDQYGNPLIAAYSYTPYGNAVVLLSKQVVPEPTSLSLAMGALLALAAYRRRVR